MQLDLGNRNKWKRKQLIVSDLESKLSRDTISFVPTTNLLKIKWKWLI